jgi:tetratricopeptide (TPR) repeat protein
LEFDSENVEALLGRAQAYENLGQVADALDDVESVTALAPRNPAAYDERARLRLQYGLEADPETVMPDLNRAVDLAPDSASTYFWRGWAVLNFPLIDNTPNAQAALPDLRQSISLDPQNGEAQFTLARALLLTGSPAEALAPANRAVELIATSAINRKLRAHIQFALGDFHAAIDDLTAAINFESDPTTLAALHAERAFLHFRLSSLTDAQADLQEALRLAPASRVAGYLRFVLDPALSRPDAEQLQAARADAPDDPIWQAVIGDLLAAP